MFTGKARNGASTGYEYFEIKIVAPRGVSLSFRPHRPTKVMPCCVSPYTYKALLSAARVGGDRAAKIIAW